MAITERTAGGNGGLAEPVAWAGMPASRHLAFFYIAYLIAAGIGQLVAILPGVGVTLWLPAGLYLATLVLTRVRTWPWWAGVAMAAELTGNALWFQNSWGAAVLINLGNSLGALVSASVLVWLAGSPVRLASLREVMALILAAAVGSAASATVGGLTLQVYDLNGLQAVWKLWWLGDSVGLLLVTPLLLVLRQDWGGFRHMFMARHWEAVAILVLLAASATLALSGAFPLVYIVVPGLLWAAVRFDFPGAVVALVILAGVTILFTSRGLGFFVDAESQAARLQYMYVFLAVSTVAALVIAGVSRENRQSLAALSIAKEELERRVAQRTAELAERERDLRTAIEAADLGVWDLDLAADRMARNARHDRMFGLERPQPRWGVEIAERHVHADDRLAFREAFARAVEAGKLSYEVRVPQPDGSLRWLSALGRTERDENGRPVRIVGVISDVTERKLREEQMRLLMREVNHRSNNTLALVQAVARQTAATSPKDFMRRFNERIRSLAANFDLLVKGNWAGVQIADLMVTQLAHFKDLIGTRIILHGPDLVVVPPAAQALGMAVHELATNAGKYGALSNADGRVTIGWSVDADGPDTGFRMSWTERGGPEVAEPEGRGFGSTVVETMVKMALDAEVTLAFAPEGVEWHMRCPAGRVVPGRAALPPSVPPSRILVVEDDAVLARDMAEALKEAGFEVLGPAHTVGEAMALLERGRCDGAVLDVRLGPESSAAVAERLAGAGTPVVVVSGQERDQMPPPFQAAPLVAKPFDTQALLGEVRRAVRDAA